MEGVQRRATKLLSGLQDMSYENRLKTLKQQSLKSRRLRDNLIQTYKILHQIDDIDCTHFFKLVSDVDCRNNITRNSYLKLYHKPNRTNKSLYSFSHRVSTSWNSLPEHVKRAPDTNSFKTLLDKENIMIESWYHFDT